MGNQSAVVPIIDQRVAFIQFWDQDIPEAVAELVQGAKDLNSELDYHMFDDVGACDFIKSEFGSDMLQLYQSCAIPAMRADYFRYCYLQRHGGIYVDADFSAVQSVAPLVYSDQVGCLYMRAKGLTNSLMYFRDAHDTLATRILEEASNNIRTRSSNNVWQVTGPAILQNLYANSTDRELFSEFHLMDEDEFALYFKPAVCLEYKRDDSHWYVAKQKGLNIFRD